MKYVIDIDGTLCSETDGVYHLATPYRHRIDYVNRIQELGHTVVIFTARGMGSSNDDASAAYHKWYKFTEAQLEKWGVKYSKLLLGKPSADYYVDDKAVEPDVFFDEEG